MRPTLGSEVARRMRGAGRPGLTYEQYDENGDIVRVEESPGFCLSSTPMTYFVSGSGWAEPRTDWRERGVVPREGIWRYAGDGSAPVRVG